MNIEKINILKTKVGYQIFPLSFSNTNGKPNGDLNGIISKLDILEELGIDIIWLSPIYVSDFVDAGYDIIDYFNVDPKMGNMTDFENLVNECKKRKIDIMMDVVLNHSSSESMEFKEACKSRDNKFHDFYVWKDKPNLEDLSIFGGSAWEYVEEVNQYYLHIFSKSQPDFNFDNPKLRQWIYEIFNFWIGKGVKYFRIDAIEHIGKTTDPYVIRYAQFNKVYLEEMYENVFKDKDVYVFGESWNINPERYQEYVYDSNTIHTYFNFSMLALDWKNGTYAIEKNKVDFRDLKSFFEWQEQKMLTSIFWTNHDTPRALNRYLKFEENQRYYAQTALHTLLFTTMGIPFIFQGEEFGMNQTIIDNVNDFRDTGFFSQKDFLTSTNQMKEEDFIEGSKTGSRDLCRAVMAWDDSPNSGFASQEVEPWINLSRDWEKINLKNDLKNENSIFKFLKKIIDLRKNEMTDWFTNFDDFKLIKLEENYTIYELISKDKSIIVIINFANKVFKSPFERKGQLVLSNYSNNDLSEIKPFEASIFWKE